MAVMIGRIITTRISTAGRVPGPIGGVLKKGNQPNRVYSNSSNGRMNGSITKMAQRPSTTDGMAASNSTITPITFLILRGMMSSVIKIAVPTPSGTAIKRESSDVTSVP